eukprot:2070151-Pleurochrysis_carterae.AAC.4
MHPLPAHSACGHNSRSCAAHSSTASLYEPARLRKYVWSVIVLPVPRAVLKPEKQPASLLPTWVWRWHEPSGSQHCVAMPRRLGTNLLKTSVVCASRDAKRHAMGSANRARWGGGGPFISGGGGGIVGGCAGIGDDGSGVPGCGESAGGVGDTAVGGDDDENGCGDGDGSGGKTGTGGDGGGCEIGDEVREALGSSGVGLVSSTGGGSGEAIS